MLGDSLLNTIVRYKWVTLIALAKTIALIWLSETPYTEKADRNELIRLSYVLTLALPLILAIRLSGELRPWKPFLKPALNTVSIGMLLVYYFLMDKNPDNTETYRFYILAAGAHLLVSYAPFIGTDDKEGFWQFNKTLFLQFLNATLYSGTLYIGLLIAVQTVKYLFGIEYSFAIEMDLFVTVFCFFHTVFFLSKIPKLAEIEPDYPNGLKIFTQYVLLPLEVVYLIILYVYLGKITVQWQLPQGRVAYLVLAFSVAGIFALLLLHPLRQSLQERWVRIFSRRYYFALLPLIVLLFTGIVRRINDYGITENRYIVAVLAFWLAGITLYFLSGKRDDIRWIPITLSILCFLGPIGPWNIFLVSKNSQLRQFEEILRRNKILDNKRQVAYKKAVSVEEQKQLISIIQFFRTRELSGLEPYFAGFKEKDKSDYRYYSAMETTLDRFAVSAKSRASENYANFSSQLSKENGLSIAGFNHAVFVDTNNDGPSGDKHVEIKIDSSGKTWILFRNKKKITTWNVAEKMKALRSAFGNHSMEVPQDSLVLVHENYKMVFQMISSTNDIYYGHGILFYK